MYAAAITNPVKAVMIFATSTDTFIVICAFMVVIPIWYSLTALLDRVETVIVLWCLLTCKACTHTRIWDASLVIEHLTERVPTLREISLGGGCLFAQVLHHTRNFQY